MKFSEKTLDVFKNFKDINPSFSFRKGRVQRTISKERNFFAEAEIEEDIPFDFVIRRFDSFVGTLTMLKDPTVEFNEQGLTIKKNDISINVLPSVAQGLSLPGDKTIYMNNPDMTFDLSEEYMKLIMSLCRANGWDEFRVSRKDNRLYVLVRDQQMDVASSGSIDLGESIGPDVSASVQVKDMHIIPDDYLVEVKIGAFSKFTSKTRKAHYITANILDK